MDGEVGDIILMKSLLLLFRLHIFHIHVNCHFQCCYVGSAVIAKLLRMQMLSDDDEFLDSEAAGDK